MIDRKLLLLFSEEEHQKEEIQIVPMIDVMLFLLVFFIVYTLNVIPLMVQDIKLPGSTTAERKDLQRVVKIFVSKDGTIVSEDGKEGEQAVRQMLKGIQNKSEASALIVADKEASVQSVIKVIDILKEEGIYKVGISSEKNGR